MPWKFKTKLLLKDAFLIFIISISISIGISSMHMLSKYMGVIKEVMLSVIYISCMCHLFLYFIGLPGIQILLSLSMQVAFHRLLNTLPQLNTKSLSFCYSCISFALNQMLMFGFISCSHSTATETIFSFLVTSMTPLSFFYYINGVSSPR